MPNTKYDFEHLLIKNIVGGVEKVAKNAKEGEKKGLSPGIIILIGVVAIIVIAVIIFLILYGMMKNQKGPFYELKKNFYEIRCDNKFVRYFPGPGFFGPPGMTFKRNESECQAKTQQAVNEKNIGPMQKQLDTQNRMLEKNQKMMENQNKMIFNIRKNIEKQYQDIYQKLLNMYKRLAYLFKKFARVFYQIFTVFKDIFMVLKYSIWTLSSMWNGPIGNTVRVLCFGGETLLKVDRGGKKNFMRMSEIRVNDMIGDNEVIGCCRFINQGGNKFYNLDGVNVSGSHLVEYNGMMIRVKDHPNSKEIKYEMENIYSIITNTGKMKIGKNIFRDHLGDNSIDTYLNFVKPIYQEDLLENIDKDRYMNSAINLYPGFTMNSYLETNNGIKKAEEIELGEKIGGRKIIGIIRYKLEGKTFITNYNLNEEHKGMLVGIQFYKKEKYDIGENEERWILGKLDCVGLLVEGATVRVNDKIEVADFDIVSEEERDNAEEQIA